MLSRVWLFVTPWTLASQAPPWDSPDKMKLEPIIQSKVSQKDKHQYSILMHIYGILKDDNDNPICKTEKETRMYRTEF